MKSGAAVTFKETVVACVSEPLAPVIVSERDPTGVLEVVVTVRVDVPEPVNEVGLNAAVAPVGNPLTLSPTVPPNPFNAPTFTVYVVEPPTVTV